MPFFTRCRLGSAAGQLHLDGQGMNAMLCGGARWAVQNGYGTSADLARIEERGCMEGAEPEQVSAQAKKRQRTRWGLLAPAIIISKCSRW